MMFCVALLCCADCVGLMCDVCVDRFVVVLRCCVVCFALLLF